MSDNQLFDRIKKDPNYTNRNSWMWFRGKVQTLLGGGKISSMQMLSMSQDQLTAQILPGKMYAFVYDPKYKETLPYYDNFPLVLPFHMDAKHVWALNLHYLPYQHRLILLNKLMQFAVHYKEGTTLRPNPNRKTNQEGSVIRPKPARTATPTVGPENVAQLKFSWNLISNYAKFPEVQSAVKCYLKGRVKSRFILIPPDDWAIAAMMPMANFKKQSEANVWKATMDIIKGRE